MPVHATRGRPPGRPPPASNVFALPKRVQPVSHGSNQSNQPSDELTHATSGQENLSELLLTEAEKGRASTPMRPTASGPDEVAAPSLSGESPARPTRRPDASRNPPPSPPGSAGTAVSANAASGKERDSARAPSATIGAGQSQHRAPRVVPWPSTPMDSALHRQRPAWAALQAALLQCRQASWQWAGTVRHRQPRLRKPSPPAPTRP